MPQENVPPSVAEKVKEDLLSSFAQIVNNNKDNISLLPEVVCWRAQLWGAANPINTPNVDCLFDGEARVGVVGDWLLGKSAQCASLSAKAMGELLCNASKAASAEEVKRMSRGLSEPFAFIDNNNASKKSQQSSDIGQFPH